ncbi:hypothetical protein [Caulobacter sp. UNC279MFTsu5.1]|uniref:hypothetical protein n=1 Tax=Caulobacter sp. UNC279MFTsu5.1 TaxID=1502775 RepID=UPI0021019E2A|nr:hypothetical protein [Caulobacter sp. UNC279MFTsu5.1]
MRSATVWFLPAAAPSVEVSIRRERVQGIDIGAGPSAVLRSRAALFLEQRLSGKASDGALRHSLNNRLLSPGQAPLIEDILSLQMFDDPAQGQVAVFGAAQIAGTPTPYALRLMIADDTVVEVEEIISSARHGHFADVDQLLKPDVLYEAPVPAHRAVDRDGLRQAADSYWQALEESDGSLARFAYRCDRYDNGKKITNNLSILLSQDAAVHTPASCINATRPARPLARNRRFPVLDTRLGVAVSFVLVDFHPAPHIDRPDCGTFYMAGLFKISDGEIRSLDEIREIIPLGAEEVWTTSS